MYNLVQYVEFDSYSLYIQLYDENESSYGTSSQVEPLLYDNYMIFKKLRNNFSLLIDSSRHVWTFELAYKLVAFAVIFPIVLFAIYFLMKIAGVNYLTNEYIQRAMTHPVVIFAIFLAIGIFVFYCTYEMTYLSVCFETKRTSCNASLVDIFYNSYNKKLVVINLY